MTMTVVLVVLLMMMSVTSRGRRVADSFPGQSGYLADAPTMVLHEKPFHRLGTQGGGGAELRVQGGRGPISVSVSLGRPHDAQLL